MIPLYCTRRKYKIVTDGWKSLQQWSTDTAWAPKCRNSAHIRGWLKTYISAVLWYVKRTT